METQAVFSKAVCQKIGWYVYRLIDPRNGETFYVGKGNYNRVFSTHEVSLGTLKTKFPKS